MTPDIAIVLAITALAMVLFVTEWIRYDVTAIGVAAALLVSGVLELPAVLSGLSNPATVAIACMLGLSAGLSETGALRPLSGAIAALAERSRALALLATLLVVCVASAFVNNTAIVVLFIPVLLHLAPALGEDASRLLMPMSFVSIIGGVCTLLGTSTNLIVSAVAADEGLAPLRMFEMLPVGAALAAVGLAYVWFCRRWLPARRGEDDLSGRYEMAPYIVEIEVGAEADVCGSRIDAITRIAGIPVDVLDLLRDGRAVIGGAVRPGDTLRLRAHPEDVAHILADDDYAPCAPRRWSDAELEAGAHVLVEAVIAGSDVEGRLLRTVDFFGRFGAVLLAVRRRGGLRHTALRPIRLDAGDCLLLKLPPERLAGLRRAGLFVVSERGVPTWRAKRAPVAGLIMLGVVLAIAFELLAPAGATMVGVLLMLLTGCLTPERLYRAIDWKIVILLAGVIPLGVAMEQTGAAQWMAAGLLSAAGGWPPVALVGLIFGLTNLLTNLISNAAAAALLTPLAVQAGLVVGVDPRPLVMAVAFGASLSFATPIGYQTNTLIYGPGQYRFGDYLRFGGPLTVLCGAVVALLVPWVWPLGGG